MIESLIFPILVKSEKHLKQINVQNLRIFSSLSPTKPDVKKIAPV